MTPDEKAEIAAAMRRIARDTFKAGCILGRQLLAERLNVLEDLDKTLEEKEAEILFAYYESKLQGIYGERN